MSDENFIPWEQIEPLVTPGMTWLAFGRALLAQLGLPTEKYKVQAMAGRQPGSSDPVHLGQGVVINTLAQRDDLLARNLTHIAPPDTPVIE